MRRGVSAAYRLVTVVCVCLALAACPRGARAQATGSIVGRVVDSATKEPLSGVAVQIPALKRGAFTDADGRFVVPDLDAGAYELRFNHVGYEVVTRTLTLAAGQRATQNVSLKSTVLKTRGIDVSGKRPLVEVKTPTSQHTLLSEDIENVPLQSVQDLIQKQAGVVQQDQELHIRGGRGDEVVYYTEGVREKDALTGKPIQSALSPRAVQELDIISGGFEAEFSDALSGVVRVTMKEGSPRHYAGFASAQSDHVPFGGGFRQDNVDLQFGGPDLLLARILPALGIHLAGEKTFYLDAGADLSDTYLPNIGDISPDLRIRSGYHDDILGHDFTYGRFFTPRQDNVWRLAMNSTWVPKPGRKFKLFFSKRVQINQGFADAAVGDLTRLSPNYPWQWSRALDRYTTQLADNNTVALSWTEAIGKIGYQELRIARTFVGEQRDVNGKIWFQYEQGFADDITRTQYFYGSGDSTSEGPDWRNRYLQTWLVDYKLTRTWPPRHKVDAGVNVGFQDAQWARINCPCDSLTNSYGRDYDVFHVYPTTGNLYLQDHVDYQGLSGHVGVGYMFWFPGALADRVIADTTRTDIVSVIREAYLDGTTSIFGHRMKSRWTPRVAVAYPITDHTKFFFNYGRYAQWPTYYYVYTRIEPSRSGQFPQKGNLALNPAVSVNYEVGVEHQFSSTMAFKVAVYNKDLYDYLASRLIQGPPSYVQFYNQDYARARGVEFELRKRRTGLWSAAATYSYSQATGKGSDPNEILIARESGATDFGEGQPREVNLYWNRPHNFTLNVDLRVNRDDVRPRVFGVTLPSEWGLNLFGHVNSGLAYTPVEDCGLESCPESGPLFSKNGRLESRWDLRFDKSFHLAAQPMRFTLEAFNILDTRNALRIDPRTGRGYVIGEGAAGFQGIGATDIIFYSNPGNYDEPRHFRAGVEVSW